MNTTPMRVSDFADIHLGGTPKTGTPVYWDGDIPWITPKDLSAHPGLYIKQGARCISQQGLANSSARLIPANSVILSTRAPVGYVALAAGELSTNQGCKNLNCHDGIADPVFVCYLLKNSTARLRANATGSTFGELSTTTLKNLVFDMPNLPTQKRIAAILAPLDEMLDINRQRIALLEKAARTLYREWFIHLRHPGHTTTPTTDALPQGWKKLPLPEVIDYKEGPGLRYFQYKTEGIPFLNIGFMRNDEIDFSRAKCISAYEVESKYQHFLLAENDHVISTSATIGRVVTIRKRHLPVMLNTSLIRMRPIAPMTTWYLRAFLKHGSFVAEAKSMAVGAVQQNFGPKHLRQMQVTVPAAAVLKQYERIAGKLYVQMQHLLDSNLHLTQVRDTLLPKLMQGHLL